MTSTAAQRMTSGKSESDAERAARGQRFQNERRRTMADGLVGQTIRAATALKNGDVALEVDGGRIVVFCAQGEDVDLREAKTFAEARGYANRVCASDIYTAEPTLEDLALEAERG